MEDQIYLNNSLPVKAWLTQNERNKFMASSLDKGVGAFGTHFINNLSDTMSSFADGVGRAAGRGACLLFSDISFCEQLDSEDIRMFTCLREFVKQSDAVTSMLYLSVCYIIQRYDETQQLKILVKAIYYFSNCNNNSSVVCDALDLNIEEIEEIIKDFHDPLKRDETFEHVTGTSIHSVISEVQRMTIGLAARQATEKVLDEVIDIQFTYVLAKYAAGSRFLGVSISALLSRLRTISAAFFPTYGLVTRAAGVAERLRMGNPKLYHLLYINNLEMFFFLLEGYLPKNIFYGDYAFVNEDDAIRFFKGLIK
ncbi:hypothetical protein [Escherichia sp. E13S3]|uniref:hypothetical protein n=1 Tax=Escherichia sp. E13S3 TaxID=2484854 RepID=UPI00102A25D3|nr:hypothetical protein [Escherichia sp. E13S3]RZN46495.1 hypothetical protein D9597_17500 [Escherichia sp. E13S3]